VIGLSDQIVNRHKNRRTDHEVDLVVVIGKRANLVSRQNTLKFVAGYCTGLDITVRGSEERSMRKSFDIYTVLGS
jgi:2-keto-4-pentenoate hydratase/2-oxohepta-3-ene-1,7-dioic acid hydratase in catechol pathway